MMNKMRIMLVLAAWLVSSGLASAQYTYTDITWPGSDTLDAGAYDINDSGVVAGGVALTGQQDGFLYSGGRWTLLSIQNGTQPVSLFGISNMGLMVGQIRPTPMGVYKAYIHGPVALNRLESAVIDGALKYPDPQAAVTGILAVNPYGTMAVGYFRDYSPPGTQGAFTLKLGSSTFNGGTFVPFAHPGAEYTALDGIDNAGDIVGSYGPNAGPSTGFRYDAATKTFENISYPGATSTWAEGISSRGVIVGAYQGTAGPLDVHGFVLSGGTYTPLNFPGAQQTEAFSVNANGIIVGQYIVKTSTGTQTRAFMATPSAVAPSEATPSAAAQADTSPGAVEFLGYQLKGLRRSKYPIGTLTRP
jgi:hypothetical protein